MFPLRNPELDLDQGTDRAPAGPRPLAVEALLECALDIVVMMDAVGVVLYASPSLERGLGYSPAEWLGRSGFEWLHPEEEQDVREFMSRQRSIPGPSPLREQRFRHKDGSWRTLELIGNNRLADPAVRGFVINGRDITERKRTEAARQESEERYRNLAEASPDSIFILSPELLVSYANRSALRWLGRPAEQVLGRPQAELFPPATALRHAEIVRRVFASGVAVVSDSRVPFPGGERWIETHLIPLRDLNNTVTAVLGICHDFTQRKQTEEAMREARDTLERRVQERTAELQAAHAAARESERKMIDLLDATSQSMLLLDLSGRILAANTAMCLRLGRRSEELVGEEILRFLPPDLEQARRAYGDEVIRTGKPVRFEDERAGIQMDNFINPVLDAQGKVTALTVFSMDITARKQAEEKLRASEALLRAAFDNAPFEFWVRDQDEVCIMQNATTVKHWGSLLGQRPEDAPISAEVLAIWQANNRRALAGEVVQGEIEWQEEGQKRCIFNVVAPFRLEGRIKGIVGFNIDVTARKRAEEALQESERRAQAILNAATSPMCLLNAHGTILAANVSLAQRLGRSAGELAGRNVFSLLPPDLAASRREHMEEAIRSGQPSHFEDERGGAFFDNHLHPIVNDRGEVVELAIFSLDITAHKRAEQEIRQLNESLEERVRQRTAQLEAANEALRTSEAKYRFLVERTPVVAWIRDEAGRISYISPNVQQAYGYAPEEIIGADAELWQGHIHQDDRARVQAAFQGIFEGLAYDVEFRILRKDGSWVWFRDRATSCAQKDGVKLALGVFSDINARKQMEATLRSREEHLRLGMESAGMVTWELDATTGDIRYSENLPAFVGGDDIARYCSVQEVLEQLHPEDRTRVAETLKRAMSEGLSFEEEYRARMLDGTYRWILGRGRGVTDATGHPRHILGVSMDLTTRKKAEEFLRNSEASLRGILNATQETIWLFSPDTTVLMGNPTAFARLGKTAEEIIGRPFPQFLPAELAQSRQARFKETIESARRVQFEDERAGIHFQHDFYPVLDAQGRVTCVATFSRDITEQKRAEVALRESEQTYRALIDTTSTGYLILDMQGQVLDANAEYVHLSGHQELPEIMGRHVTEWTAPHDRARNTIEIEKCLKNGSIRNLEVDYAGPNGRTTPVEINATVVQAASGARVLSLCRDITARKQAEATLAALPRRIFEAQETERKRVARELHDGVNQLLSTTKFRLHEVEETSSRLKPEVREALGRCRDLLGQALEETRRIARDLRPRDLDDLGLGAACNSLCTEFQSRTGVLVQYDSSSIVKRLPPDAELHLFRILQEALHNVEEHAQAAQVRVVILQRGRFAELKVEDNGHGFDPAAPRPATASSRGLGLPNMRERAAALGGTCQVLSSPGRGTRVLVRLPVEDPT